MSELSSYHEPFSFGSPARYPTQRFLYELMQGEAPNHCIEWPFARSAEGYGRIRYGGRCTHAHRVVCTVVHGEPASENLQAAHSCGNSSCVNPKHLNWKTPQENANDKSSHGTVLAGASQSCSKLDEAQVRDMRSLEGRASQRELARRYGVSRKTVWAILRRQKWDHVQ